MGQCVLKLFENFVWVCFLSHSVHSATAISLLAVYVTNVMCIACILIRFTSAGLALLLLHLAAYLLSCSAG